MSDTPPAAAPQLENNEHAARAINENLTKMLLAAEIPLRMDPKTITKIDHAGFTQYREIGLGISPPGAYRLRLVVQVCAEVKPELVAVMEAKAKGMKFESADLKVLEGGLGKAEDKRPEEP